MLECSSSPKHIQIRRKNQSELKYSAPHFTCQGRAVGSRKFDFSSTDRRNFAMKTLQLATLVLIASTSLTATAAQPYRDHHNNVPGLAPAIVVSPAQTVRKSMPVAKPAAGTEALTNTYRKHHNNVLSYDAQAAEIAANIESLPATAAGNTAPAGK
jgi:hypothetical protein